MMNQSHVQCTNLPSMFVVTHGLTSVRGRALARCRCIVFGAELPEHCTNALYMQSEAHDVQLRVRRDVFLNKIICYSHSAHDLLASPHPQPPPHPQPNPTPTPTPTPTPPPAPPPTHPHPQNHTNTTPTAASCWSLRSTMTCRVAHTNFAGYTAQAPSPSDSSARSKPLNRQIISGVTKEAF